LLKNRFAEVVREMCDGRLGEGLRRYVPSSSKTRKLQRTSRVLEGEATSKLYIFPL
jgi:hypothetical protein